MSDAFDQAMAGLGAGAGSAPSPSTPAGSSPSVTDPYGDVITHAAQTYNVDPRLIRAVIQTESNGQPGAVSSKGATGLMQINPSNYKALGITNPADPTQSIMGGAKLMSQLLDRYGDVQTALTHYVGGDDPKQWGPQTTAYPSRVLANFNKLPASTQTPQGAPAPTPTTSTPPPAKQDAFDSAMAGVQASSKVASAQNASDNALASDLAAGGQPPAISAPLAPFGKRVAGLTDTLLSAPGAAAGAADYALRRAFQQSPEQAQAASSRDFGGAVHPVGNLFGVTNTPEYQGEPTQRAQQVVGDVVGKGVNAVAGATGLPAQDVSNMAGSLSLAVPGAAGKAAAVVVPAMKHLFSVYEPAEAAASPFGQPNFAPSGSQASAGAAGRGSVGAAGTSFAQQAAAEGVPDALVQKIAAAEKSGSLNPVAAGRHIEAGSLPVPIELTAGQASGDVHLLSNELNSRGKNPDLGNRFNAQNGQLADNLSAIRDQVSPNVNVPSGTPTGQALVDAYKEMDGPIREQISGQYARARNADGTSALVDAAGAMRNFESQIGPTRFNALPSRVQQIFADAKNNSVTLPAHFDQTGGATRPMNARDIMDIDQTLSGAIAESKSPAVQHDIGQLRDAILSAPIDPAAGPEAVAAFKTAQASARARFQAMDADPAYKAAANDIVPHGEPSPLADQFVQKYIAGAGGKAATANVQNMLQNLSNDPLNRELVASALMDHIRAQAGIDLRTGSGNISQAGLNKAIQNLGDKTRIVLGPEASQTVEKLGNVARYTQEQPRGSYVNNSNTAVTLMGHAGNLAKSTVERGVNAVVPGAQLGSWARETLANRANAKEVARSLELGAGLKGVPLNSLIQSTTGKQ